MHACSVAWSGQLQNFIRQQEIYCMEEINLGWPLKRIPPIAAVFKNRKKDTENPIPVCANRDRLICLYDVKLHQSAHVFCWSNVSVDRTKLFVILQNRTYRSVQMSLSYTLARQRIGVRHQKRQTWIAHCKRFWVALLEVSDSCRKTFRQMRTEPFGAWNILWPTKRVQLEALRTPATKTQAARWGALDFCLLHPVQQ